jgi:hypothetical protein
MKIWKSSLLIAILVLGTRAERIRLNDGTVLEGKRVRIEGDVLIFKTATLDEMRIPIDQIAAVGVPASEAPKSAEVETPVPVAPAPKIVAPPVVPPPSEDSPFAQSHAEQPAPAPLPLPVEATPTPAPAEQVAPSPMRPPVHSNSSARKDPDPHGQTLVLMPTAFTAPEGSWTFKDFELLFLTLSYAPTASTSVSFGALFPISTSVQLFTFGVKQQLFLAPDGTAAVAVDGNLILPSVDGENSESLWDLSLIGSVKPTEEVGLHASLGTTGLLSGDNTDNLVTLALGMDARMTPNAKFIVEFYRTGLSVVGDENVDFINIGFRLHGERLSVDICGTRPLVSGDTGDLLFYPVLNVGYRF